MQIQFLEMVTKDVEGVCATYERMHGVKFSDPDPMVGGGRTAALAGGGKISVRAPLRPDEDPVVRPYMLVDDIKSAVAAAAEAGAEVAIPPMEIPGHGTFAIFLQGGNEHGLWQL